MHQASVGVHCPECFKGNKQKVYTSASLPQSRGLVTTTIIAVNVLVFIAQVVFFDARATSAGASARELSTWGQAIDLGGEWWRIISGGFGHFGIIHLGMNMYSLYILGPLLERTMGPVRYSLAYSAALVGGSFGALVLEPNSWTMGASGAIFGLLGLLVIMLRSRGIGLNQSGLGQVLLLNLFITFSGYVSVGGHVGGFIVGIVLGIMYWGANPGDGALFGKNRTTADIITAVLLVALFVGGLLAATRWAG